MAEPAPPPAYVAVPARTDDPDALTALFAALVDARYVGGWVRDRLLGHEPADIDVASPLPPSDALRRVEAAGLGAWTSPSGLAHGTIGVVVAGRTVEVTTLRRDVSTDGRRATVAFTDDWRADAARRDFTINALSADPITGRVHDHFDGLGDLASRRVRFIGDPLVRIAEDHLRILRFFRFHARFGEGPPDPEGYAACAARANDLMALSRERIAGELIRLLAVTDPGPAVAAMLAGGILAPVLPEVVGDGPLAALVASEREAGVAPDGLRRLAALLPADPSTADRVASRLRLSKADRHRLVLAADPSHPADPRALAYAIGPDAAVDRLLLRGRTADARALSGWRKPAFPLGGGALIARGMTPGPNVARTLRSIEARWVAEGFPDDRRLDELVADALRA